MWITPTYSPEKQTVIPRYIAVHVSRIQYIADFSVFNVLYNVIL